MYSKADLLDHVVDFEGLGQRPRPHVLDLVPLEVDFGDGPREFREPGCLTLFSAFLVGVLRRLSFPHVK